MTLLDCQELHKNFMIACLLVPEQGYPMEVSGDHALCADFCSGLARKQ